MMFEKTITYDVILGRLSTYRIRCKKIEIEQVIKLLEEELKE